MKMEILLEPTSNKDMVGETVTHWFTLIALSALRHSDNENMLSLMNLILMSILTDLQVTPTKPGRMIKPYSSHRFIANCFNAGNLKMEVKQAIRRISRSGIQKVPKHVEMTFLRRTLARYHKFEKSGISSFNERPYQDILSALVKNGLYSNILSGSYIALTMTSLADKALLSGADNHPPMLEKGMYDSWKSIMELYMLNRQHGRMILKSVENGPLLWPTVEENGVTRPKKYSEISAMEAIQADCDVKATNIILQGLPPE
nr:hypothetical protein [Tanacetum cinerariifolium]